jgi:hypothetical protein
VTWFGGKSRVGALVWQHIGDVENFIEPFFGSGATLLLRPHPPRIETVNDLDCYVSNFWRATQQDPEAVATFADGPVNEVDLHSRHRWLVLSDDAEAFRERMRRDPEYFDAKIAGWWCWGLCCWIGSGWCNVSNVAGKFVQGSTADGDREERVPRLSKANGVLTNRTPGGTGEASIAISHPGKGVAAKGQDDRKPRLDGGEGQYGHGVHAKGEVPVQLPMLTGDSGASGRGVHGKGEKRPKLTGGSDGTGTLGCGVHQGKNGVPVPENLSDKMPRMTGARKGDEYYGGLGVHTDSVPDVPEKRPRAHRAAGSSDSACNLPGVLAGDVTPSDGHRPQLADAFSRGRGVHGNDDMGTCAQRRAWLLDWFGRLRDRLRTVRVCCGDWLRVCDSESVTTRLGTTGIFFDPPYGAGAGRNDKIYSTDSLTVAADVLAYCLERGADPRMRIALAGYAGEGHEVLEAQGWEVVAWEAAGGYGNRSAVGKANAKKERLWFSPACASERTLFS